jgi:lipopolysaccharide transport system ATP-binding protein
MSEVILQLKDVGKKYNFYHDKKSKVLNLLGVPVSNKKYFEYWALRDISFELKEGERVGLIGRNGAGKSTTLKLIAGTMKPSTGSIVVNANIQALLELGTGFHPEFTGRQNIYSSLSYHGVTGRQASALYDEIVDFSELEKFIDRPLKTYSSGMYSRLAFSIATSIIKSKKEPGLLIIDEVLGAGDAYFSAKCAALMKQLTSNGASVLFVSHDISAVQMICNRAIWIERGTMIMDADPLEVSKEYAASIRRQENIRLRALNMKIHKDQIKDLEQNHISENHSYVCRLITKDQKAPKSKHPVLEISLYQNADLIETLRVGEPQDNDASRDIYLLTTPGYMNWSQPQKLNTELVRYYSNNQGKYLHAPFVIKIPKIFDINQDLKIKIKHACSLSEEINLEICHEDVYLGMGEFSRQNNVDGWVEQEFSFPQQLFSGAIDKACNFKEENNSIDDTLIVTSDANYNDERLYGDKKVIIKNVEFCNLNNEPQAVFNSLEYLSVRIQWESKEYLSSIIFVVCIYGLDGRVVSQALSQRVNLQALGYLSGNTTVSYDPLLLGPGEYVVSIGIFTDEQLHQDSQLIPHYVIDREFRLKIQKAHDVKYDFGEVYHPVRWSYINKEALSDID